jgi:hypothetical protein
MYAQANQGVIPRDYGYPGANKTVSLGSPTLLVPERFSPYVSGRRLPLIPRAEDPAYISGPQKAPRDQMLARIFIKMDVLQCPSFPAWAGIDDPLIPPPVVPSTAYDYVVNAFPMDKTLLDKNGNRVTDKVTYSKLDRVRLPGKLFYLLDGNKTLQPDRFEFHDMHGPMGEEYRHLWWGSDPRMANDNRHDGRVNALCFDTHVDSPVIKNVTLAQFSVRPLYDASKAENRPPGK